MKKQLLIAGFTAASMMGIAQIPTSGLTAHYPFNGNANDESTNSNNGSVSGATLTTDRFGNINSAYSFDGVDDQITITNFTMPSHTASISIWCKADKEQSSSLFRNNVSLNNLVNTHVHWSADGNDIYWDYGDITSGSGRISIADTSSPSKSQLGNWEHFVFVVDSASNSMSVYHNGTKVASSTKSSSLAQSTFDFFIGGDTAVTGDARFFEGLIDDIRIYDRVLTDCEIASLNQENDSKVKVTVEDTLNIYLSQVITTVYKPSDAVSSINVYPNPSAGNLTVEIENHANLSGVVIKVLDAQSTEVHNESVTSSTQAINVSGWSAGIYFLHVLDGSRTVDIRKIVVNN